MKKHSLIAAFLGILFIAVPAFSQVTGGPVLDRLYDDLSRQSGRQSVFSVERSGNAIVLRDRTTGAEVVSVREVGSQTVTVSGVVGRVESSPESETILKRIALFNFSSPVGTLQVDGSGAVTMSHHLNPRAVSVSSMARVALLCGDVARNRVTSILQ